MPTIPFHPVNQITHYTCGLACLEGISHELGRPVTQQQLMLMFKTPLVQYAKQRDKEFEFGAATDEMLAGFWTALGFKGEWRKGPAASVFRDDVLMPLKANERVLIHCFYKRQSFHTFRFAGMRDNDSMHTVMTAFNLNENAVDVIVSLQQLVDWDYSYAIISLKVGG